MLEHDLQGKSFSKIYIFSLLFKETCLFETLSTNDFDNDRNNDKKEKKIRPIFRNLHIDTDCKKWTDNKKSVQTSEVKGKRGIIGRNQGSFLKEIRFLIKTFSLSRLHTPRIRFRFPCFFLYFKYRVEQPFFRSTSYRICPL